MSILPILQWPDPRLTQICAPVAEITPEITQLAANMLETMYAAPGRGLAGPQVGAMTRIFVMDTGWKEGTSDPLVCINPEVQVIGEERAINSEGCLSILGVSAQVSRPAQVQLIWTGLDGERHTRCLSDFGAVCAQHENDHLDGVLTLDHLDAETRRALEAEYAA